MKVALFIAGQPRFTPAFHIYLRQLKGITQGDFHMCLWESDWAWNEEQARAKIEPMLGEPFKLKKLSIVKEPPYQLPPYTKLVHVTEEKESVRWWYKRRRGMWQSTNYVFNMIDDEYDAVIKCRGDGRFYSDVDIASVDISKGSISPSNCRHGIIGKEVSDQWCMGTYDDMKFFSDMIYHMDEYIPEMCPDWETDVHRWASEYLLGRHYLKYNRQQLAGNFQYALKADGRAYMDDKDLHVPITQYR